MLRKYFTFPVIVLGLFLAVGLSACDKHDADNNQQQTTVTAASGITSDSGTDSSDFDSNPADAPRINVKLVEEAINQTQKDNPTGFLDALRIRVNEIYEGDDVVSLDAHPDGANNLQIIGYISHSGKEGYQADSDELIFNAEQTGAVTADQTPYRMTYSTYGGSSAYYDGYYSNPYLNGWYYSGISHHTWSGYYTSQDHIVVIHQYRDNYRTSDAYLQQRLNTHAYYHETYHGPTLNLQHGTTLGTGITASHGAAAAAPAKVSAPPAYKPHFWSIRKSAPAATGSDHSHATGADLEKREGGLFNKNTFHDTTPRSVRPSRSSGGSRSHR